MGQSDTARQAITEAECLLPLDEALEKFASWLGEGAHVWGNGAASDNVWLRQAYANAGIVVPWQFYHDRCYRTLKSLFRDVPYVHEGVKHNAIDDARSQANHLLRIVSEKKLPIEDFLAD
jgi:hypothetical protein